MSMKVGIIGSGQVGVTLANGFTKHGYDVMIGTNSPAKYAELKEKTGGRAKAGSFSETASFAEVVVLAVKGTAAEAALGSAGVANLKGKIVMDATNPIADAPPVNGVIQYFTTPNQSLMERLQQVAPEARFVKAFSCVGNPLMVNPDLGGVRPTMFICGNDAKAKGDVTVMLNQFGWDTEDMGMAEGARAIEPLAMLWCIPGFLRNSWSHAFKVLRK